MNHDVYRSTSLIFFAALGAGLLSAVGCGDTAPEPEPPAVVEVAPVEHHATPSTQAAVHESAPRIVETPAIEDEPPPPVEPELRAHADVTLRRMALSRTIEAREPVDAGDVFGASSDRLYAFFDIRNGSEEEQTFTVTFEGPAGRSTGHVELTVPAEVPRWRTWAWTRNATEPGDWVAEIRSADGTLLGSHDFTIE